MRFASRAQDPLKKWKLSATDLASFDLWDEYTKAREDMFFHTDTHFAPWTVVKANDKRRARLEAIKWVLSAFNYTDKDRSVVGETDPLIIGSPRDIYDSGEEPVL